MRLNLLIILLSVGLGALSAKREVFTLLSLIAVPILVSWAAMRAVKSVDIGPEMKIFGYAIPLPFVFVALFGSLFFGAMSWAGLLTAQNFSICLPTFTLWCLISAAHAITTRDENFSNRKFIWQSSIYLVGALIGLFFFRTLLTHVNWIDILHLQTGESVFEAKRAQIFAFAIKVCVAAMTPIPIIFLLQYIYLNQTAKLPLLDKLLFLPTVHAATFAMMFTVLTPLVAASPIGELVLGQVPTREILADSFRVAVALSTVPSCTVGMFSAISSMRKRHRANDR